MITRMLLPTRLQEEIKRIPEHTPDLGILMSKQKHLYFHFGYPQKHLPRIGGALTSERMAMLRETSQSGTPPLVIRPQELRLKQVQRARISGLLYLITTEDMTHLDKYWENGVRSNRERIRLILPQLRDTRKGGYAPYNVDAWMHIGDAGYSRKTLVWEREFFKREEQRIYSPAPVWKDERPWIGDYYYFIKGQVSEFNRKCTLYLNKGVKEEKKE